MLSRLSTGYDYKLCKRVQNKQHYFEEYFIQKVVNEVDVPND